MYRQSGCLYTKFKIKLNSNFDRYKIQHFIFIHSVFRTRIPKIEKPNDSKFSHPNSPNESPICSKHWEFLKKLLKISLEKIVVVIARVSFSNRHIFLDFLKVFLLPNLFLFLFDVKNIKKVWNFVAVFPEFSFSSFLHFLLNLFDYCLARVNQQTRVFASRRRKNFVGC